LTEANFDGVHFVYPNAHLMNRDKKVFDQHWHLSSNVGQVKYHDSLNFDSKANELIIVDEADAFYFSDPDGF
jgi:hypothetical protein